MTEAWLLVDEDAIRRSAGFLLRTAGFDVVTYESGMAFLAAVGHAAPGCVLLDIRMPGLDGLDVQRVLGERGIAFPVIVLTGRPQDAWLATWSRAEAAVPHPIDPIQLAEAVIGLLRPSVPATS